MNRAREAVLLFGLVCACDSGGFASHPDRGPIKLAFTAQPTGAFTGAAMDPVAVTVQDAYGNTVSRASASITLSIGTNPAGGTLSGTTTVSAADGVALFSDLVIDKRGAGYTLTAEASGLTGATSGPIDVTVPPSKLAFGSQPNNSLVGRGLGEIRVSILDELGDTVTSSTMSVKVAIATGPAGATLSGTSTVAAVNGVATFPDLSIDIPGGYTLAASACSLIGATTASFIVVDPASVNVGCWNVGPPANFPLQIIGASSAPRTVTLINTCNSAQELVSARVTSGDVRQPGFSPTWPDFSLTNNCPASIGADASCTFEVTFKSTGPGPRGSVLVLNENLPDEARLLLDGMAMAALSVFVAPDPTGKFGQFAYVANARTDSVSMYRIDHNTGALTFLAPPSVAAGTNPASVAVDPSGRFAYVANAGSNDVSSYRIGADGTLASLGSPVAAGTLPFSVAVAPDPTGRFGGFTYVANAGSVANADSGDLSMYTIDHDTGALTPVGTLGAPWNHPYLTPNFLSVAVHPSGNFAYTGVSWYWGSHLLTCKIDTTTGALGYETTWGLNSMYPTGIAVDPSGKFLALSTQFPEMIELWTIDPTTGATATAPLVQALLVPSPTSVAMAVGPSGELFAYATTSRVALLESAVLTYRIDTSTWAWSLAGTTAAGMAPTSIAIDPSGRFAYVANSGSGNISMYSINADGTLTPLVPGTIGTQ